LANLLLELWPTRSLFFTRPSVKLIFFSRLSFLLSQEGQVINRRCRREIGFINASDELSGKVAGRGVI
jgi:hypothetical protein